MRSRKVSPLYLAAANELQGNDGQWEAYCSGSHCAVTAGPGSGKTKTLTLKLARMLTEDVRYPAGVACITYSHECARELDRRLDKLGVRDAANLYVGTIHGFCLKHILRPYAPLVDVGLPDPIVTATQAQQRAAYDDAVRILGWAGRLPYSLHDIGTFRRIHLDNQDLMQAADRSLAGFTALYMQSLRRHGVIDFDDQVLLGLRIVENYEWCRRALAAKFPIIAVDEYQDLGRPLDQLVHRLAFDAGVRLFVVGDVDQAIYGFTGADGNLLGRLVARDDVQGVTLELNYRSAGGIVQAAQWALGEDRPYRAVDQDRAATIEFHHCDDGAEAQAREVIDTIIPAALAAKPGRAIGNIAILYRTAAGGDAVAAGLDEAGIPYIRTDTGAPYTRRPLTSWIEDMASWASGGWRTAEPTLANLIRRYENFKGKKGRTRESTAAVVSFLSFWRDRDGTALDFVEALARELVIDLVRHDPGLADQMAEVARMMRALQVGGALHGISVFALGGRDGGPNTLNLLTLHAAKGCEYDAVIMVGLDQGAYPWTNETEKSLAESRRLFYVGITRARDEVHLVYSGSYADKYGRVRRLGPSIFVSELEDRIAAEG